MGDEAGRRSQGLVKLDIRKHRKLLGHSVFLHILRVSRPKVVIRPLNSTIMTTMTIQDTITVTTTARAERLNHSNRQPGIAQDADVDISAQKISSDFSTLFDD